MKKVLFICLLFMGVVFTSQAQKFAYIDSDYVLRHVPAYTAAQAELNKLSSQWQNEIEQKYDNIQKLEEAYNAEKILLPSEMKKKREDEIKARKMEAKDMQKQKFGVGGELFSKREEFIKPIQEEIYSAIEDVCSSKGYIVMFDKSNNSNMLYSNPKYDVSDQIIRKMGLTPGELIEAEDGGDGGDEGGKGDKGGDKGGSKGGDTKGDSKTDTRGDSKERK